MTQFNTLDRREDVFFLSLDIIPQAISIAFTVSCSCSIWEKAEGIYSQHS